MGSISRYIFRSTTTAFLVVLLSLTAIIWVTQALRDLDLMTNRGQSIAVFVGITSLLLPMLMMLIAPVALFVAFAYILNKLSTDSEIIVFNASGMSPAQLFRAFLPVALMVSVVVAVFGAYLAPKGLRTLREWVTSVNANVVSTLVQPGRFVTIISNVTINIASRDTNGQLRGVFIDDRRDPNDRNTIIAARGDLLENKQGTFLVLQNGTAQRQQAGRDPNVVTFERYAIDLAQFSRATSNVSYSMHARYLWQLLDPEPRDASSAQKRAEIRAEIFDRLMAPLYPFVFAIIAFAYLGAPRTTRENRTSAMAGAVGGILLVRLVGFASTIIGVNYPFFLAVQFIVAGAASVGGLYVIRRGTGVEPPAFIKNSLNALSERISRRVAAG
jgi:lipopolysaccharide export system permease protein